jgi:hypothetical protein
MSGRRVVALLGRRDEPTDAVEEYCHYLGCALRPHGFDLELARVPWMEEGWPAALRQLGQRASAWRGEWVLAQYTALGWSERGFPLRFQRVLTTLRAAGARVGVVFHDVEPYGGERIVDRVRRRLQLRVMRRVLKIADLAIFTVPLNLLSWLADPPSNARFIPIGANLALPPAGPNRRPPRNQSPPLIVVYGITGGEAGKEECRRLIEAIRFAAGKLGTLVFYAFGRGANERAADLHEGLRGATVDLRVDGVLPAERVVEILSTADAMLFVREPISSRRGSAIAGISCGLPMVAYSGPHTATPITDAGVVLVSRERTHELGEALVRVLSDASYRATLAKRSRAAYSRHLSWDAIATQYAALLTSTAGQSDRLS